MTTQNFATAAQDAPQTAAPEPNAFALTVLEEWLKRLQLARLDLHGFPDDAAFLLGALKAMIIQPDGGLFAGHGFRLSVPGQPEIEPDTPVNAKAFLASVMGSLFVEKIHKQSRVNPELRKVVARVQDCFVADFLKKHEGYNLSELQSAICMDGSNGRPDTTQASVLRDMQASGQMPKGRSLWLPAAETVRLIQAWKNATLALAEEECRVDVDRNFGYGACHSREVLDVRFARYDE